MWGFLFPNLWPPYGWMGSLAFAYTAYAKGRPRVYCLT